MEPSEPLETQGVGPIRPAPARTPRDAPPAAAAEFSKILEDLQTLARPLPGEPGAKAASETEANDPPALIRRLEQADESFQKLMEIRGRLEQAWSRGRNTYGQDGPG